MNSWSPKLHGPADGPRWYDHAIIQDKLKKLPEAADAIGNAYRAAEGNCPVINDELAYQGEGDKFTEGDVIESHLGAFLGGGYASTGYKPGNKKGHYFWGAFDPDEHTAADNLKWLRERIDTEVAFWKMRPVPTNEDIFENTSPASRVMAWDGRQYVLGTNGERRGIRANLPDGKWRVERLDAMAMKQDRLSADASGAFTFDAPASRAVLFVFTRQTAGDAGDAGDAGEAGDTGDALE